MQTGKSGGLLWVLHAVDRDNQLGALIGIGQPAVSEITLSARELISPFISLVSVDHRSADGLGMLLNFFDGQTTAKRTSRTIIQGSHARIQDSADELGRRDIDL